MKKRKILFLYSYNNYAELHDRLDDFPYITDSLVSSITGILLHSIAEIVCALVIHLMHLYKHSYS